MMKKRVVITGMGVISPVGIGTDVFWNNLIQGKSGIKTITNFDTEKFTAKIAGEVLDFDPLEFIDKKESRRMDRFTQFAVAATSMAIKDAGLDLEKTDRDQVAVIIGSGIGGIDTFENQTKVLLEKGPSRISPFFVPMMICNMAAGQVAINFGLYGPNFTVVTACASASNAIGEAFRKLQSGEAEVAVTGGTEAPVTPLALSGFCAMKALSTRNDEPEKASRPFDVARDGFVMGEGAGILILETLDHALARGARIYAEVAGYGATCDGYHITAPAPDGAGAFKCMKRAIDDAGLIPTDIDYINGHGTSTEFNDRFESIAIKKVFGADKDKVAVSSTKSMTGHLLGAAGAIEAIVCVQAINNGEVPPTINLDNPGEECDLDYVPNVARKMPVNTAMSNSFGFGGHNATLVFKKYGSE